MYDKNICYLSASLSNEARLKRDYLSKGNKITCEMELLLKERVCLERSQLVPIRVEPYSEGLKNENDRLSRLKMCSFTSKTLGLKKKMPCL